MLPFSFRLFCSFIQETVCLLFWQLGCVVVNISGNILMNESLSTVWKRLTMIMNGINADKILWCLENSFINDVKLLAFYIQTPHYQVLKGMLHFHIQNNQ